MKIQWSGYMSKIQNINIACRSFFLVLRRSQLLDVFCSVRPLHLKHYRYNDANNLHFIIYIPTNLVLTFKTVGKNRWFIDKE